MNNIPQYKLDLVNVLSGILTNALLKPAAMDQLVAGLHTITFEDNTKPHIIQPFNPEYMEELTLDLSNFIIQYTTSTHYTDLIDNKVSRTTHEFVNQIDYSSDTYEKFMAVINQFSQLLSNVETFLDLQLDPLLIDPRYDFDQFNELFILFGKINSILHIEIIPSVYPILYTEYDLRDPDYPGYVHSRSEQITFQISSLVNLNCEIVNNINQCGHNNTQMEDK
jgi:hypothetical protein